MKFKKKEAFSSKLLDDFTLDPIRDLSGVEAVLSDRIACNGWWEADV